MLAFEALLDTREDLQDEVAKALQSAGNFPSVTPIDTLDHKVLQAYVDGALNNEEKRRVDEIIESDPLLKEELRDLYILRTEIADYRPMEVAAKAPGFWAKVSAVFSRLPETAVLTQSFAPSDFHEEHWQRLSFPETSGASGAVKFDQGNAVISIQAKTWLPGQLVRLQIKGVQNGDLRSATGIIEQDVIPSSEVEVPFATEQPIQVTYAVVTDDLLDAEIANELLATFSAATNHSKTNLQAWSEWATSHTDSDHAPVSEVAKKIFDQAESLLSNCD
jgi:hypothetical protein